MNCRPTSCQYARPYTVVRVPGTSILSASAGPAGRRLAYAVRGDEADWRGLEIDPRSGFVALACYFDQEQEPVALWIGERIARPFRTVAIHPLFPAILSGSTTSTLPASSTPDPAPALCQQDALLRFYSEDPDGSGMPPGRGPLVVSVTQQAIVVPSALTGNAVLVVHMPCVNRIRVWGTNNNVTSSALAAVSVSEAMPPRDGSNWQTPAGVVPVRNIGSFNIAAGADGNVVQVLTDSTPSGGDIIIMVETANDSRFQVGVIGEIDR